MSVASAFVALFPTPATPALAGLATVTGVGSWQLERLDGMTTKAEDGFQFVGPMAELVGKKWNDVVLWLMDLGGLIEGPWRTFVP